MATPSPLPVALDGYGTDAGSDVVVEGARLAAADGIPVRIFGPSSLETPAGVELDPTTDWIGNEAEPVAAVRSTPEASIVRGASAVANAECSALVSAGSTGATMTAALFAIKRAQGVHRPALAVQIPVPDSDGPPLLFLDCGANTDVRPQHLIQFAFLGSAFSAAVLGVESPRVALLSVGEEQKKGRADVVEAHEALTGAEGIRFIGNLEGRDMLAGEADVIVTDGFTGNVTLKTVEGTARAVADAVRDAARSGPLAAAGGLLLRPALGGLRSSMDPNSVGGAILLGLRGVAVVAHGSSTPEGIANAIRLADRAVRERAVERTGELLSAAGATRDALRETPSETAER
jgi:glycerol-3-phosphate acyltransferase PlsX